MHLLTFANVKWARYSEKTDHATAQKGPFGVEGAVSSFNLSSLFLFLWRDSLIL